MTDHVPRAPAAAATVGRRGSSSFGLGRLLRWWLVTGTLLLVAIVVFVGISGVAFDFQPLHIAISGDDFANGVHITGMTAGAKALLVAAAVVVILVALVVAPLVLLAVFLAVTAAVVGTLLGMALAVTFATSPVWIVGLVVWYVRRRRRLSTAR